MICTVNRLFRDLNKDGEKTWLEEVSSCPTYCISIGERDWVRKRGIRLDGKTQERKDYAGKNLKNHWRAQRKWGREKKERQAKSRGGTSERGEVKKCTRKRRRGEKGKITVIAWGKLGRAIKQMHARREKGKGGDEGQREKDENLTERSACCLWLQ